MVGIGSGHTALNVDVISSKSPVITTAGTDYLVPSPALGVGGYKNVRSGLNKSSALSAFRAGVPIITLGTQPRLLAHWHVRTGTIPVALDEYCMTFGGPRFQPEQGDHAVVASTTVNHYQRSFAPVVIDPGDGLGIGLWAASMAGTSSIEWELVWSER